MEQLLSFFIASGFKQDDIAQIAASFSFKKVSKGSLFAEEGKTSKHLAYITKGLFQYYYLKDGKELTTYITGKNTFLASVYSFFKQKPGREFIKAITDAEVWTIHYDDLAKLKTTNEAFRTFYIGAIEDIMIGMDETRANLMVLTAEERYELMLKEEPQLLQQIPLQYLATILAVTPRHLSRIRNNAR
jgi:CRP/FNR family transcriptional regulator, anaerobic regulatory protein